MKIGIFTDTFYPEVDGVATSCLNLYRALTKRGHEVRVYAPKCKDCESMDNPDFHYLASAPFLGLKDRNFAFPDPLVLKGALDEHFDVVHTNSEFVLGTFGRFVAKVTGCAAVHTYHTAWEDYTYYVTHGVANEAAKKVVERYSEWWCDKSDRNIVPTAKTKELLEGYNVEIPVDVIPSGFDLDRFAPEKHPAEMNKETREECGVKENERVLLNIGRLAKEKDVEKIMRVFPRLLEQCPDVRFVVVGEGPQKEKLAEMAAESGVTDHVSIVGSKPWEKIDRYYAIGDVFAAASHSETQGLTYIEAMASGLCLCAVNDPCLNGVAINGFSGILTGDDDEVFLAGLVRAFSPEGAEIRKHAIDAAAKFGTAEFAAKVEACYMKAIESYRVKHTKE